MDFIKKNIKNFGIIGCILMIVGNFLPFITTKATFMGESKSASVSLMADYNDLGIYKYGISLFLIEVIMLICVLKNKKKILLILNTVALLLFLNCYEILDKYILSFDLGVGSVNISFGIAIYVIVIGIVLGYVFALAKGEEKPNESELWQNIEDK